MTLAEPDTKLQPCGRPSDRVLGRVRGRTLGPRWLLAGLLAFATACGAVQFEREPGMGRYAALPGATEIRVVDKIAQLPPPVEVLGTLRLPRKPQPMARSDAEARLSSHAARYGCDAIAALAEEKLEVRTPVRRKVMQAGGAVTWVDDVEVRTDYQWAGKCVRTAAAASAPLRDTASPSPGREDDGSDAERARRQAEAEAAKAREQAKRAAQIAAEKEEQARKAVEAADKDRKRREAEAIEKERKRKEAEQADQERRRREAERAEKERLRRQAEDAEKARKVAEAEAARAAREAAEAAERARKAAEAAEREKARVAAELADRERKRQEAEAAAEAERKRKEAAAAAEAERKRKAAEAHADADAQARARAAAEAAEKARKAAEAAEREQARTAAEVAERDRKKRQESGAAEAEQQRREAAAAETERRRKEADAAEAERQRQQADAAEVERRRKDAEVAEAERKRKEAEAAAQDRNRSAVRAAYDEAVRYGSPQALMDFMVQHPDSSEAQEAFRTLQAVASQHSGAWVAPGAPAVSAEEVERGPQVDPAMVRQEMANAGATGFKFLTPKDYTFSYTLKNPTLHPVVVDVQLPGGLRASRFLDGGQSWTGTATVPCTPHGAVTKRQVGLILEFHFECNADNTSRVSAVLPVKRELAVDRKAVDGDAPLDAIGRVWRMLPGTRLVDVHLAVIDDVLRRQAEDLGDVVGRLTVLRKPAPDAPTPVKVAFRNGSGREVTVVFDVGTGREERLLLGRGASLEVKYEVPAEAPELKVPELKVKGLLPKLRSLDWLVGSWTFDAARLVVLPGERGQLVAFAVVPAEAVGAGEPRVVPLPVQVQGGDVVLAGRVPGAFARALFPDRADECRNGCDATLRARLAAQDQFVLGAGRVMPLDVAIGSKRLVFKFAAAF